MLNDLGVTPSRQLLARRSASQVLVAGVKVATQTPPVRSGRRVVFLTLDDSTGPVDATFFEDVQGPYAATVFGSWLLLVRGITRRTGPRGISIRATGAWELGVVYEAWKMGGKAAVAELLDTGYGTSDDSDEMAVEGRASSRSSRPVAAAPPEHETADERGERLRRVLVHASGFRQSPYADIAPQGVSPADTRGQAAAHKDPDRTTPRKLWHSSNGSSGW
jgi:error-prone DNA polymerase